MIDYMLAFELTIDQLNTVHNEHQPTFHQLQVDVKRDHLRREGLAHALLGLLQVS